MALSISDNRVFFVNIKYSDSPEMEGHEVSEDEVNPIAQGLKCTPSEEGECWGYCSWFDKVNAYMRTIELKSAPIVDEEKKLYTVTSVEDLTYQFRFIDKSLYDNTLRLLLGSWAPQCNDDEAVQKYLRESNPYTN